MPTDRLRDQDLESQLDDGDWLSETIVQTVGTPLLVLDERAPAGRGAVPLPTRSAPARARSAVRSIERYWLEIVELPREEE